MFVLLGGLVALVAVNLWLRSRDDDFEQVEGDDETLTVAEALGLQPLRPVVVGGFVFDDQVGLRLCQSRNPGDPPECVGPWLDLERLDTTRLVLEQEGEIVYSTGAVRLGGEITGTVMAVTDILPEDR